MTSISINVDYLRSWNGILKIVQLVVGTISVGLVGNDFDAIIFFSNVPECFFLIITSTFYIGTFILFISYLISPSAASIIPKTIYEFLYHTLASILLLAASIAMMVQIHEKFVLNYTILLVASICSLLNTVLYICSAIMGFSTYGDD